MPLTTATKGDKKETVEGQEKRLPPVVAKTTNDSESEEDSEWDPDGDLNSSDEEEQPKAEIPRGPPVNLPPPPQFLPPPIGAPPAGPPPPTSNPPPPTAGSASDEVSAEADGSKEAVTAETEAVVTGPPQIDTTGERETPNIEDLPSKFYKVLFDYPNTENEPDTLTLRTGDILIVLETRTDGWWRGQSGDQVGLFPVDYCESVGEEEVKAFIAKNSLKAKATASAAGAGSRAELEREMKDLQAEEAALAAQAKQLKEEVATMKEDARKLRKKTREELLEIFDSLPAALYQISTFGNLQHDIVRCAIQIAKILDIELDHKDLLPDSIMVCSSFVEEAPKIASADPKLKTEVDKVISKVLALQKFFLDEHANVNVELPRKVVESLELLTAQIQSYMNGDLDLSAASPHPSTPSTPSTPSASTIAKAEAVPLQLALNVPTSPIESPSKKRSKSTKSKEESSSSVPTSPISSSDAGSAVEDASVSPREKRRRKKERASVVTGPVDEEDATNGKESKDKERKKKRKDKEGVVSPRKSSKADPPADIVEDDEETRSKDKKSKKKRATVNVEEDVAVAENAE